MDENNIKLLLMWYQKCKLFYHCHRDTSYYFINLNRALEIPVIIIHVFNTTSLFATYQDIRGIYVLCIAILSLSSTILSALQTYFAFNILAIKHNRLMIEYSRIIHSIEKIIILIKNNNKYKTDQTMIDSILTLIEHAREEYIHFPEFIWNKYNKKFQTKLDNLDITTSDSIDIILKSIKENNISDLIHESINSPILSPKYSNVEIITYDNQIIDIKKPNDSVEELKI
jgi:hypothetical protein